MAPIYKVWMMNYKPAWYELSKSEQDVVAEKVATSLAQVGGKRLLVATSLWADEKWAAWGIEEFPNIEAVMQFAGMEFEAQGFRYMKSWSTLGVLMEPGKEVVIPKAAVYQLAFFNLNEAWYRLSEAERAAWDAKHEALYKQFGAQNALICNSGWCSEGWLCWLVVAFPSQEALMGHRLATYEAGWYQYVEAKSLLGVKWPME